MKRAEAIALMKKHEQICVQCGGVNFDGGGFCVDCSADDWLEPDDFTNNNLPWRWAESQIGKLMQNTHREPHDNGNRIDGTTRMLTRKQYDEYEAEKS